jgi:protease-4
MPAFRTDLLATLLLAWLIVPATALPAADDNKPADDKTAAKAAASKSAEAAKSVAVFRLEGSLKETPGGDAFPFDTSKSTSLKELLGRLDKAKEDKAISAIVLLLEGPSPGLAQIEELRNALAELKAADKEVYAHSDSLDTSAYVLLSGASRLSMSPTADLWLVGAYGESPYLRDLLEKIGVRPDFLTCGAYKSAAEMFMRASPSPEAEKMQNWLLDGMYQTQLRLIAEGRKVSTDKARQWVDDGPYTAEKAKAAGLIDAVEHRQDFVAAIKKEYGDNVKLDLAYGKKKANEVDLSSPFGALQLWSELLTGGKKKAHKTSVAVVYVDGPIALGSPEASLLGSTEGAYSSAIRKALDEAARDDTVKAVVLRVDSPGGSAVASEIILDAAKRVKAKKPLVVSMGNVAASGGYYVACSSDLIYADEGTITGSIGVVAGKLATTEMWNKLGVHWKSYKRGKNAGLLSSASTFSDEERQRLQGWMDEIYGVFKGHVVAVRGDRLKKDIEELAGGRVYTGRQALELGLVDKIGTLGDAVEYVAAEAKLEDYEIRALPEPKNFLELLLDGDKKDETITLDAAHVGGKPNMSLVQAALPLLDQMDPVRLRSVLRALRQLETLQHEGAALIAPEFLVH